MKKLLFISCLAAGLTMGITMAEEEKDEKTEEKVIALTNEIEHQSELDDYLDAQRTKLYLDKSITTEQWKIEYADLQQQSLNLSEKERQEVLAERQQSVNQLIGYLIEKRLIIKGQKRRSMFHVKHGSGVKHNL